MLFAVKIILALKISFSDTNIASSKNGFSFQDVFGDQHVFSSDNVFGHTNIADVLSPPLASGIS